MIAENQNLTNPMIRKSCTREFQTNRSRNSGALNEESIMTRFYVQKWKLEDLSKHIRVLDETKIRRSRSKIPSNRHRSSFIITESLTNLCRKLAELPVRP